MDEQMMPKLFQKDIKIELWARMGLIFRVLRGSAGGSIFNEFLKANQILSPPSGDGDLLGP